MSKNKGNKENKGKKISEKIESAEASVEAKKSESAEAPVEVTKP